MLARDYVLKHSLNTPANLLTKQILLDAFYDFHLKILAAVILHADICILSWNTRVAYKYPDTQASGVASGMAARHC